MQNSTSGRTGQLLDGRPDGADSGVGSVMVRRQDDSEMLEKPSKSERKRAAHAAQELGEELLRLRDPDLDALHLPDQLSEAIRAARRITSRGGSARQRQYIGKLMRGVDLEPIRAALGSRAERAAREAEQFKRLEEWRERLLAGGAEALTELERWRPLLDRAQWLRQISAARAERDRAGSGPAGRELLRALRSLFSDEPPKG